MKTSFSLSPVAATILMAAEIIVIAALSLAIIYLVTTFFYSWWKNGSFSAAATTFEENVAKVGKALAAPFVAVGMVFKMIALAIVELFRALSSKVPWNNSAEFFAWIAGADLEVWRRVSSSTRKTRTAMGVVIFVILSLTSALAGHNFGNIYHSLAAGIVIGIAWFVAMISLDRAAIKWMDNNLNNWKMVAGRLLLVFGIGFINTVAVLMDLSHDEIMGQIAENKTQAFKVYNDSIAIVKADKEDQRQKLDDNISEADIAYTTWVSGEQAKIDEQRAVWTKHQEAFMEEAAGRAGSHLKGWGDAARANKAVADADSVALLAMMVRYDSVKTQSAQWLTLQNAKAQKDKKDAELLKQIAELDAFLAEKKAEITNRKEDGYWDRFDALFQQAFRTPARLILFVMWFAFLFMLEGIAVLMKMLGGIDDYNKELIIRKRQFETDHQYAAEIALQQAANDHANAIGALYQQSVASKAMQAATMKAQMATMNTANVEFVKEIQRNIAAINAATASMEKEDADVVKRSLKRELFQKIGFN